MPPANLTPTELLALGKANPMVEATASYPNPPRFVLAIDPGEVMSAWVKWDAHEEKVVAHSYDTNAAILEMLRGPDAVGWFLAIEMIDGIGARVGRETFETVFWSGMFAAVVAGPFRKVYRREVKRRFHVKTRAKKGERKPPCADSQIRTALLAQIGPKEHLKTVIGPKGGKKVVRTPGPTYGLKEHQFAALAVAVTLPYVMIEAAIGAEGGE